MHTPEELGIEIEDYLEFGVAEDLLAVVLWDKYATRDDYGCRSCGWHGCWWEHGRFTWCMCMERAFEKWEAALADYLEKRGGEGNVM